MFCKLLLHLYICASLVWENLFYDFFSNVFSLPLNKDLSPSSIPIILVRSFHNVPEFLDILC